MVPGIDPTVDYAFKRIFGREEDRPLLIDMVNAVRQPPPGQEMVEVELPIHRALEVLNVMTQSELERERYEARLKAQRDQISFVEAAAMRGRAEGEMIGEIHVYQRFLKRALTPREELLAMSANERQRLAKQLEKEVAGDAG